jgi:hypothetical protein
LFPKIFCVSVAQWSDVFFDSTRHHLDLYCRKTLSKTFLSNFIENN